MRVTGLMRGTRRQLSVHRRLPTVPLTRQGRGDFCDRLTRACPCTPGEARPPGKPVGPPSRQQPEDSEKALTYLVSA